MKEKISWIAGLRGLACFFVVLWHYIGIYGGGGANSAFPWILPRPSISWWAINFTSSFAKLSFNFGQVGVSIFFLITGFLCISSLDRDDSWRFLIKKVIRLYPVYIVSVLLVYFATLGYTAWAGTEMPFPFKSYLVQMTLLGDWIWYPGVDGIAWTMEVQLKMYIVYYLLYRMRFFDKAETICKR